MSELQLVPMTVVVMLTVGGLECRKLCLLVLKLLVAGLYVVRLALLFIVDIWGEMQLTKILRTSCVVCRVLASAINAFWGRTDWFCAVFRCMLLVTFYTLWGTTTKVGRIPEGLTVETLSDGSGILEFFPPDYAVA